jgi:hypothetical protein
MNKFKKVMLFGLLLFILPLVFSGCMGERLEGKICLEEADIINIYAQQIELNNESVLLPDYTECYFNTPIFVTFPAPGVFYAVAGILNVDQTRGFKVDGTHKIIYTDNIPRVGLVSVTLIMSVAVAYVPANLCVQLYKNGVAEPNSSVTILVATADETITTEIEVLVTFLSKYDYLEVYLASDKKDVGVTICNLKILVTTLN